jgi:hypothetical protein
VLICSSVAGKTKSKIYSPKISLVIVGSEVCAALSRRQNLLIAITALQRSHASFGQIILYPSHNMAESLQYQLFVSCSATDV